MKPTSLAASLAAASLFTLIAVPPVHAQDSKVYSPTGICAPYTPTTSMAELIIRPGGITNGGTTAEAVLCSLPVDAESGAWTATDNKYGNVNATFNAGSVGGNFLCQVYVSSGFDGTPSVFTTQINLAPLQVANVVISSVHADAVSANWMVTFPVNLYCRIPPKSTLLRIRVTESGPQATDTSGL